MSVLLTGATGFLGMELLVRLLEETDRDVVAMIRAPDDDAAAMRLDGVLATLLAPHRVPAHRRRVRAVAADLEHPHTLRRDMIDGVDTLVHCAASVAFDLSYTDAHRINVAGTEALLDLAAGGRELDRIVHVSTAYVAGEDGEPRNTYEETKREAEAVVDASGLPVVTVRPSIVVGDSTTGWTPVFNVIYWPLQAFARGLFKAVPGDPDGRVDVVPVDTVADALLTLATGERRDGVVQVVSGDAAPTGLELARIAAGSFGARVPDFVAPGTMPDVEDVVGAYLPYFRVRTTFATTPGFEPPALDTYFDALMDYARRTRWGKRPLPRWELQEALEQSNPMAA